MITFSLGFMTQQAHAAQEDPALRAQAHVRGTALKSTLKSEQGRKLGTDVRVYDQLVQQWYKSICYVNDDIAADKDFTKLGSMTQGQCREEGYHRNAAGVEWEREDGQWSQGECTVFVTNKTVRDCSSILVSGVYDPCEDWADSDWGLYCMVLGKRPKKGANAYVGCFKDNTGGKRDLSKHMGSGKNYKTCARICKRQGYKYFGRQQYNHCFCGNTYGSQGSATTCDCDNKSNVGNAVNCVYKTG